jgi:hypothetical protein
MVNFFGRKKIETLAHDPAARSNPREKNAYIDIRLLDREGEILYQGRLNGIRFPEKLIISKSIYFFNDEAPCFIHRSAVAVRLFEELNRLLEQKGKISAAELGEGAPGYLDEYPGLEYIESTEKPDK